ncbi:MAG: 4-hydroxythreonine-4-phosphate dehydrogenase PdxA [Rikenellaceae bacterium]
MSEKIKVGITHGDINGVGYEVIIKTLLDNRMCELCTPIVYGSSRIAQEYKAGIAGAENFSFNLVSSAREARPGKKPCLINCVNQDLKAEPGKSTKTAGKAAVDALNAAVKDLKEGAIDVLVTAPISKENVQSESFNFTGHTEFLADAFSGEPIMIMCSELLKVGLVTIHTPITKVIEGVTKQKIVEKIYQLEKTLKQDFSIVKPRIAVFALNPHAGDGGMLGTEENEIITPAINEAIANKVLAFGPFPADGFFAAASYKNYDGILAIYHDQGLAPFKALSPDGVNFSANLAYIRTSPDHGVAYDIAGKDVADPSSMRAAIYSAIDIYRSRKNYKQISARPLRKYEREKGADVSVKDLPESPEA